MKIRKKINIYNSTTLYLSKAPSNSSILKKKLKSLSIKSTKLKGDLQPILTFPKTNKDSN